MRKKERLAHCPEVEKMMDGRMPFITRHGITVILAVLILASTMLLHSHGSQQRLTKELITNVIEQMKQKIE